MSYDCIPPHENKGSRLNQRKRLLTFHSETMILGKEAALGALITVLVPVALCAAPWHFKYDLEGGASYWAFSNETGELLPTPKGNEVRVSKSDDANDFGANGACTEFNCEVSVWIGGQSPEYGQTVEIEFDDGKFYRVKARSDQTLLSNGDIDAMETANGVIAQITSSAWMTVRFGDQEHRFSLEGSKHALDGILRVSK